MTDIEQRLSERFHEQVEGIEPYFDLESVIAGTRNVAVSSSARRSNRVVLRAAVAGIAAAGIIGLIALSNRTSPTPSGTAAQPTQSQPTPAGDPTPTLSIPRGPLDSLVAGATPRFVLSVDGINLFLANPDSNSTCIIIDTGDGYPAGCTENNTIATGEYWQLSRDRPESPSVLAGVAPDDVTRVVVNGTDAAIAEHAWLVVTDVAVDSYTLVHADGTSQTINLNASGPPTNTVPGSTTPATTG